MPYVQDRRRRYKRKPFFSKSGKRDVRRTYPRNSGANYLSKFNPFPQVHYAELRYVSPLSLTIQSGVNLKVSTFSANNIYWPHTSSAGGGQPYGHDQYAAIYNHYQVLESYITMTPMGPVASNHQTGGAYGITLEDSPLNQDVSIREITEKKGTSFLTFAGRQSQTPKSAVSRSYHHKFQPNKSDLHAKFNSGPSDQMYYSCFIHAAANATNVQTEWMITINYKVKMWEIRDLGTSSSTTG